jgi:hypothetical protein
VRHNAAFLLRDGLPRQDVDDTGAEAPHARCILDGEAKTLAGLDMRLFVHSRRVSVWRATVLWLCVLILLISLANRIPHFSAASGPAWVRAVPSQMTAKLLIKDLCFLQPPRPLSFVAHSSFAIPSAAAQRHAVHVAPLDDRLGNRPPPLSFL